MKRYWIIFWKFRHIQLMKVLEYRGDFIFWSIVSLMWTAFNFFFFYVLADVNNGIGGWNVHQMNTLMAVFTILDAFTWSIFYHNMQMYTRMVFSGDLNQLLVKPVDTQFLLMTQTNSYNNFLRLFAGVGMLFWSVPQLGITLTVGTLIGFIVVLLISLIFIYTFWFMLSTLSFWVEKLDNINDVIPSLRRVWQVPREVYRGVIGVLLTLVVPLGLVVSLPAEIIIGNAAWEWIAYFGVFTLLLTFFSRWFFNFSIRRYSGIAN
jgi:ABC-2 type transport system permease protein